MTDKNATYVRASQYLIHTDSRGSIDKTYDTSVQVRISTSCPSIAHAWKQVRWYSRLHPGKYLSGQTTLASLKLQYVSKRDIYLAARQTRPIDSSLPVDDSRIHHCRKEREFFCCSSDVLILAIEVAEWLSISKGKCSIIEMGVGILNHPEASTRPAQTKVEHSCIS